MDLEKEIERIKQNKSLKHIESDNEFDEREDLFVDKIDDEWMHMKKKSKIGVKKKHLYHNIRQGILVKNVYLEVKYKKFKENKFKKINIFIDGFYNLLWFSSLYIHNLIIFCIDNKKNNCKIPLVCFKKYKIIYLNSSIFIQIDNIPKSVQIFLHYDYKKINSDKLSPYIKVCVDKDSFINYLQKKNDNFLIDKINYYFFSGSGQFIMLLMQNEESDEYSIIEKIKCELIIFDYYKYYSEKKQINISSTISYDIDLIKEYITTEKYEIIKFIIPKDKIIVQSFMNKTMVIFGLDNQFTGIKSIKQILCSQFYSNKQCFLTIVKNMQFFPSTPENIQFYGF